jgi:hypothetical protein
LLNPHLLKWLYGGNDPLISFSRSFLLGFSASPTSLRQRQLIALVATPLEKESLRKPQDDRLCEAHEVDERSNIYIALPNRLAKVQLGMGIQENPSSPFPKGFGSIWRYLHTNQRLFGEPSSWPLKTKNHT